MKYDVLCDAAMVPLAMLRINGSDDLFPDTLVEARHPYQSVNYVNSHDGLTLYDLVFCNRKHNDANGHDNEDGNHENYSWNCDREGDESVPKDVVKLRLQQAKNFRFN